MNDEMVKVAIVTGAAKNIGRATCESLSKLGYNILVHANTDKDGADETVKLVKENGVQSERIIGDLTKPETSQELVKEASKLGNISALVDRSGQNLKKNHSKYNQGKLLFSIYGRGIYISSEEE